MKVNLSNRHMNFFNFIVLYRPLSFSCFKKDVKYYLII